MTLTPPLHDLSVHQSFPVFPVLRRERGSSATAALTHDRLDPAGAARRCSSCCWVVLSQHSADRLVTDPEFGGQRAETLGSDEGLDRCLLLRSQLASAGAVPSW
jgi:hypothetical protein